MLRTDVVVALKDDPVARTVPVVVVRVECLVTADVDLDRELLSSSREFAPRLDNVTRGVSLHPWFILTNKTICPNIVPVDRIELETICSELDLLPCATVGVRPHKKGELLVTVVTPLQVNVSHDERVLPIIHADNPGVPPIVEVILEGCENHVNHQRNSFVSM